MNKEESKNRLGEILKRLRISSGFTQNRVADYLHIDRSTYTKYEHGREPELDSLIALAKLYGLTVDELISGIYVEPSGKTETAKSPKSNDDDAESFLPLSDEEKRLLIYFRTCAHPSNIMNFAKKLYLDDVINSIDE